MWGIARESLGASLCVFRCVNSGCFCGFVLLPSLCVSECVRWSRHGCGRSLPQGMGAWRSWKSWDDDGEVMGRFEMGGKSRGKAAVSFVF